MGKGLGIFCIILGICCLIAAVGLIAYNRWEEETAQSTSQTILQDIRETVPDHTQKEPAPEDPGTDIPAQTPAQPPAEEPVPEEIPEEIPETPVDVPREMLTTQVNGHACIGILSIPVLELELPVLTNWSEAKLKLAPCHYFGSCYETDFVIAAHNYRSHFGRLSQLQPKDLILFTDISGTVHGYEVVLLETLPADATEAMITSGFDLSLYTCTPGGASRITVRCSAISK